MTDDYEGFKDAFVDALNELAENYSASFEDEEKERIRIESKENEGPVMVDSPAAFANYLHVFWKMHSDDWKVPVSDEEIMEITASGCIAHVNATLAKRKRENKKDAVMIDYRSFCPKLELGIFSPETASTLPSSYFFSMENGFALTAFVHEDDGRVNFLTKAMMDATCQDPLVVLADAAINLAKKSDPHLVPIENDGRHWLVKCSVRVMTPSALVVCPTFLAKAAKEIGGSYYIYPESISRLIFERDDGFIPLAIAVKQLILEKEASVFSTSERLSNTLYHYDASSWTLETAAEWLQRENDKSEN